MFNPNNPKKSFDVYIDKDPSDTIPIKYTTVSDVENTIHKLEKLYKTKNPAYKVNIFSKTFIKINSSGEMSSDNRPF